MLFAILLQHIIFLVSIVYFKRTANLFLDSSKAVWLITLAYAVLPGITNWSNCILTESLSISGSVFLFYNICLFFKDAKRTRALWATMWLLFLILLRPAFVYLIPVCLMAWVFATKRCGKIALYGLAGVAVVVVIYLGYCSKFKEQYGIFSTSRVNVLNQSYLAFRDGLMKPEFTDKAEYGDYIKRCKTDEQNIWETLIYIFDHYDLPTIQKSLEESYKNYPMEWAKKAGGRYYRSTQSSLMPLYAHSFLEERIVITFTDIFPLVFKLNFMYLFLLLYIIFLAYWMIKSRTVCSLSFILWLTIVANVFTAVVGAQGEWGRLVMPSTPMLLILIGQATNFISFRSLSSKDVLV